MKLDKPHRGATDWGKPCRENKKSADINEDTKRGNCSQPNRRIAKTRKGESAKSPRYILSRFRDEISWRLAPGDQKSRDITEERTRTLSCHKRSRRQKIFFARQGARVLPGT
jgi:hypothetical protein